MNEVIRLKKIEEKKEIDEQLKSGILLVGSPGSKRKQMQEMSDFGFALGGAMSAKHGGVTGLSIN